MGGRCLSSRIGRRSGCWSSARWRRMCAPWWSWHCSVGVSQTNISISVTNYNIVSQLVLTNACNFFETKVIGILSLPSRLLNVPTVQTGVFCLTAEGGVVPAELSIARISLRRGLQDMYHTFIEPGPIPKGYRADCYENSKATHKIPLVTQMQTGRFQLNFVMLGLESYERGLRGDYRRYFGVPASF